MVFQVHLFLQLNPTVANHRVSKLEVSIHVGQVSVYSLDLLNVIPKIQIMEGEQRDCCPYVCYAVCYTIDYIIMSYKISITSIISLFGFFV